MKKIKLYLLELNEPWKFILSHKEKQRQNRTQTRTALVVRTLFIWKGTIYQNLASE